MEIDERVWGVGWGYEQAPKTHGLDKNESELALNINYLILSINYNHITSFGQKIALFCIKLKKNKINNFRRIK